MKVQYLSWIHQDLGDIKWCKKSTLLSAQTSFFLHPSICFCLLLFFFFIEDCVPNLPYPTKLIPPAKAPLCPPSISLTDCPNPGLSATSIVCDVHENPYSPYRHNFLYNKVSIKYSVIQDLCRLLFF